MTRSLVLQSGAARCVVLPELGGSLGGWWINGQPLLRPADPAAIERGDPAGLSGFPLVPYSNRIAGGRFVWNGTAHRLRRNLAGEPHAIHGIGWQRSWQVRALEAAAIELSLTHHESDDWPWPFTASQTIRLTEFGLDLDFAVRNRADEAAPLSFGYHPYFERAGARVQLSGARVWLADATNLPSRSVKPDGDLDLSTLAPVARREIDNCYAAVSWPAWLAWEGGRLGLELTPSANLRCAVVYSSAAANALCIEPVAHVSNALNLGGEHLSNLKVAPGATVRASLALRAQAERA